MRSLRDWCSIAAFLWVSCWAFGQDYGTSYVVHPNVQARVRGLALVSAESEGRTPALAAALQTIFRDAQLCCGHDSALEDMVAKAGPLSLQQVAERLKGKFPLSDGRPVEVTTECLSPNSIRPEQLVTPFLHNQPMLLDWESHLYVVYGVVYNEKVYDSGAREYAVEKLLLFDPEFSSKQKEVVFDRQRDDWTNVKGLMIVSAVTQ